ncbi:hypothetical protein PV05_09273 [Exophiala xenobiotica]|uniref:Xylanolytic transcriptional activator regulatory domain-containing protein n=1 Tax=Exophiala xenobiotica TaxID=348802 RepID=A0A0D2CUH1_9EURO|nr:uncharacterized protein PV05_09273 [Exophiala xenobiotica]KIW53727.1 hypothetical protein PV05_09273 [Exophiala xenobiotica]
MLTKDPMARPPTADSVGNNAMLGLMQHDDQEAVGDHGDSSASSFMNHIRSVFDRHTGAFPDSQSTAATPSHTQPSEGPESSKARPSLDYVLPPRQRADYLLNLYWRLMGNLHTFLDIQEVKVMYERVWTGKDLGEDALTFLCLMNVIFSIACLLDSSIVAEERVKAADIFYKRSQDLLGLELMQRRSVLTVQCFLLLGQYLQSTDNPQQCWIFVGIAVRIAQSLALDLPSTNSDVKSMHRGNVLRMVWHGCVLMDRTLSMTFGRPVMITSQAASAVPLPTIHKCSDCDGFNTPYMDGAEQAASPFFLESLKLHDIMSNTLLALYSTASSQKQSEGMYATYFGNLGARAVGNILQINKQLSSWVDELPEHLRNSSNGSKTTTHRRQTNIIWLQYRHVRILLFRPVLSRFCSKHETRTLSQGDRLPFKLALHCSVSCVRTALDTITFFERNMSDVGLNELDDILPAWWYSIFYLYTAATVMVAARLHPSIVAEVKESVISNACHAVIKIFERFQCFGAHAKKCAAALHAIFEQVQHQNLGQPQLQCQTQSQAAQSSGDLSRQQQQQAYTQDVQTGYESRRVAGMPSTLDRVLFAENCPVQSNDTIVHHATTTADGSKDPSHWALHNANTVMTGFDAFIPNGPSNLEHFDLTEFQHHPEDISWLTSLP